MNEASYKRQQWMCNPLFVPCSRKHNSGIGLILQDNIRPFISPPPSSSFTTDQLQGCNERILHSLSVISLDGIIFRQNKNKQQRHPHRNNNEFIFGFINNKRILYLFRLQFLLSTIAKFGQRIGNRSRLTLLEFFDLKCTNEKRNTFSNN